MDQLCGTVAVFAAIAGFVSPLDVSGLYEFHRPKKLYFQNASAGEQIPQSLQIQRPACLSPACLTPSR
jgi:hypothetical protein